MVALVVLDTGCAKKSPAPPELLDRLKAFVENNGRPAENVFSVPGGVGSASGAAGDKVEVKNIKYASTISPLSKDIGNIPAGTIVHYYNVDVTITSPDGSNRWDRRIFYVYQAASGEWSFIELNRPAY